MRAWTPWEVVRHQVAICGRVLDASGSPVARTRVTITGMPEEFERRVENAVSVAEHAGNEPNEGLDRTVSQTDGIYYFLDLPAGRYTLSRIDARSGMRDEASVSVTWSRSGRINMAVADFKPAVSDVTTTTG